MKHPKSVLLIAALAVMACATVSHADEAFDKAHPRRAKVLNHAAKQEANNNAAAADGKISAGQDAKLNKEDRQVKRMEERQTARRQADGKGNTISTAQEAKDEKAEAKIHRQRDRMETRDAAKAGTTAPAAPAAPAEPAQ